jgi:hypothetical protein
MDLLVSVPSKDVLFWEEGYLHKLTGPTRLAI